MNVLLKGGRDGHNYTNYFNRPDAVRIVAGGRAGADGVDVVADDEAEGREAMNPEDIEPQDEDDYELEEQRLRALGILRDEEQEDDDD